jgi:predicted small metal-binding protein
MFGKAKCKICGEKIRFALRHLRQKHPETLIDEDISNLRMENIMKKYFS